MHIDTQAELMRLRQKELQQEAQLRQAIRAVRADQPASPTRRARLAALATALAVLVLAGIATMLAGGVELAQQLLASLVRL